MPPSRTKERGARLRTESNRCGTKRPQERRKETGQLASMLCSYDAALGARSHKDDTPRPSRPRGGGTGREISVLADSTPGGPAPKGAGRTMFKATSITDHASHGDYRVSLRSSSKRVPSNPSSNGVCYFFPVPRFRGAQGGTSPVSFACYSAFVSRDARDRMAWCSTLWGVGRRDVKGGAPSRLSDVLASKCWPSSVGDPAGCCRAAVGRKRCPSARRFTSAGF